jgi:hypothetical protein
MVYVRSITRVVPVVSLCTECDESGIPISVWIEEHANYSQLHSFEECVSHVSLDEYSIKSRKITNSET